MGICDYEPDVCALQKEAYEEGLADGKRQGAAEERARIVAWLNKLDRRVPSVATLIADGDHMPKVVEP